MLFQPNHGPWAREKPTKGSGKKGLEPCTFGFGDQRSTIKTILPRIMGRKTHTAIKIKAHTDYTS